MTVMDVVMLAMPFEINEGALTERRMDHDIYEKNMQGTHGRAVMTSLLCLRYLRLGRHVPPSGFEARIRALFGKSTSLPPLNDEG